MSVRDWDDASQLKIKEQTIINLRAEIDELHKKVIEVQKGRSEMFVLKNEYRDQVNELKTRIGTYIGASEHGRTRDKLRAFDDLKRVLDD